MSHLTADIICRTIFSQPLSSDIAGDVFNDFLLFERSVASVNLAQLIFGKPWAKITQPPAVVQACQRIRRHIGTMLDPRIEAGHENEHDDIVSAVITACDTDTGQRFTREELIDQIGVFFLAGHETTASVLTWVFFILSQQPDVAQRIADDVHKVTGGQQIRMEHLRQLPYVRNVFREVLRLYPPITFLPRVALESTTIADKQLKRGAMIMISPWTSHRNGLLWENPDRFDPDRFDTDKRNADKGTHLSFGVGPRVCIGASFATLEATLIIARLAQRYQFKTLNADTVRPVARLTTRPAFEIQMQVSRR